MKRLCSLLACAGLAMATLAHAEPPAEIAFVGRMISDLDKSIPFYQAIGFSRDGNVDSSWHNDEALNNLLGLHGVTSRTARLTINSNVSGKPFSVYLHELRGVKRKALAGYVPWEPGASHFGLVVPDAPLLWKRLEARGMLHARSWGGKLIPFPGETQGALAYMTDPDGMDIEIINQRPAVPAANGRPARPAMPPGVSHAGLVILDADKERAFYGNLLGGKLASPESPWMQGDFTDSAVGGHGNILRFFNEQFPEATDPKSQMHFELVEFQNRKKPVETYSLADISVGYVGFQVHGLDKLLKNAKAEGAKVVSAGGPSSNSTTARAPCWFATRTSEVSSSCSNPAAEATSDNPTRAAGEVERAQCGLRRVLARGGSRVPRSRVPRSRVPRSRVPRARASRVVGPRGVASSRVSRVAGPEVAGSPCVAGPQVPWSRVARSRGRAVARIAADITPPRPPRLNSQCRTDRLGLQDNWTAPPGPSRGPSPTACSRRRAAPRRRCVAVDPHRARLQAVGDLVGLADVARPHARGQAIDRVVGAAISSSSASLKGVATTTGPKISSRTTFMSGWCPPARWAGRNSRGCRRAAAGQRRARLPRPRIADSR